MELESRIIVYASFDLEIRFKLPNLFNDAFVLIIQSTQLPGYKLRITRSNSAAENTGELKPVTRNASYVSEGKNKKDVEHLPVED